MARNLHISYDLYAPGQNYETVRKKIESLGNAIKIHKSFWYVKSNYTAAQARDAVWAVMDRNDTVYVVDATNNEAAWQNISDAVSTHINKYWFA